MLTKYTAFLVSLLLVVSYSCTSIKIVRHPPAKKPFLVENQFELKGGNFTTVEKELVLERLSNQVTDSAEVDLRSPVFFIDILNRPKSYDTAYSNESAKNMEAAMFQLGYYKAVATYRADTTKEKVRVKYTVQAGPQTLVDTLAYKLSRPDLQALANESKIESFLKKGDPISKVGVLGESARLVDTFRNNGYYKFTAAELRMRGDTTIALLTNISDDPFEQLALLQQAQQQRDSPTIKLQMVLVPPEDSTKLLAYHINDVYVLEDYFPGDNFKDTVSIKQREARNKLFIRRFHERYVTNRFLAGSITLRPDSLYRQRDFYSTLDKLTKAGVWQNINIRTEEVGDSAKLNVILELQPVKKFGFETSLEASYSSTSNTNTLVGGSLFGTSINFGLTNRNIAKQAIKMTHSFRAGVEFNNNGRSRAAGLINSNELTYTNNVVFPRRIAVLPWEPIRRLDGESFINSKVSLVQRLFLFNLNTYALTFGSSLNLNKQRKLIFRPLNFEYNYLNKTDSFQKIIASFPYLRYSYNTSLILGPSATYTSVYNNPRHLLSTRRERYFKTNVEESGNTYGALPILKKNKSRYIKADVEYKYTITYPKTALVFRLFTGVGIPINNDSIPFFKQYAGGGSNSMRGWPIRGIGLGSQKLAPFGTVFNERTGDIQIEGNAEYRYDIARIIPNTLTLRGALFIDAGNVWNFGNKSNTLVGDSAQFKFSKLYRELGVSAGTGFRLDFNYFVLRFDLGFRFKRPELSEQNAGWKLPPLHLSDAFQNLFLRGPNDKYRRWRYENFNLTVGISYPF